jgi:Carboxypeptidase regulatory-like domain/TonB-dependent Receptor Plug Domain
MKKLLLLLCMLTFTAAWAQIDRASISGTVTDQSGAIVAGATVNVESAATGLRRETQSNEAGIYLLPQLPIGAYTVSANMPGFQAKKYQVTLVVGQVRTLDIELSVGGITEDVAVVAEVAPLQLNNAEIGVVVEQTQIAAIPLNGRNWSALLQLAPGATNTGEGSQNTVRFNGRGRDENNFTFDGVDATGVKDPRQEANLRLNISLDSIEEFRVSSGLYNAESGNGAGAQMNLVSKSGTNEFHGGLFEFFRNDKLDARRPIDAGKPPFRLNQFGGNIGGPIVKNKTFFFANYEGLEQRLASTLTGSVPSASFKAGVPAALRSVMDAYDPGTARTSQADIDTLTVAASQPWTEKSALFKVDHRFSDNTSMFVRYNFDDGRITELRNALLETRTSNFRTQNGVIQFQHIFSPAVVSETRIGVNRSALHRITDGTFPEGVSISGFISLQADQTEVEIGTSYSLLQSLTWIRGGHTLKFGGEVRKIDLILSNSGSITTTFASRPLFLQNRADSITFASALPGVKGLRPYYFGYAQDEFKASRTLTLSLGTRYEYFAVAKTNDGRGRVFDLERCNGFCAPGTPWYFPDKNNWAPRVGMAWAPERLKSKTVFRLGYGMFYGPGQIDDVNAAIDSIPETLALSVTDQPALSFPALPFIGQARSTGVSARALQRDRRDGYSQEWTFAIQHQLPSAFVLQTAYVGGNGHHLFGRSFINTIDPATGRRPYPNYSNVDIKNNTGNSSFNSLQVSLQRSAPGGLRWQTQYMWSHNISDNSGAGDGLNLMISNCRVCDRGDADWDIRHTITGSAVYALPFGAGRRFVPGNSFVSAVFGGWNFSMLGTARTGVPFSVTVSRSAADLPDGVTSTPGKGAPPQRPNVDPNVSMYSSSKSPSSWLNPAAFQIPPRGTWGTLPRNALRGPNLWQFDLSASKESQISERIGLELRAESFNIFNRAQYGSPNANFSNLGTFGTITSVVNANPTGAGGPRQVQLALRLKF